MGASGEKAGEPLSLVSIVRHLETVGVLLSSVVFTGHHCIPLPNSACSAKVTYSPCMSAFAEVAHGLPGTGSQRLPNAERLGISWEPAEGEWLGVLARFWGWGGPPFLSLPRCKASRSWRHAVHYDVSAICTSTAGREVNNISQFES